MTGARMIAVVGSMCAALLATWLGNAVYMGFTHNPVFSETSAIWMLFGGPAALVAAIATFLTTKDRAWLKHPIGYLKLSVIAIRTVALACLLYLPIQIAWLHVLVPLHLMDAPVGPFNSVDIIALAYIDLIAILFGILPATIIQMAVLLFARSMVPKDELSKDELSDAQQSRSDP